MILHGFRRNELQGLNGTIMRSFSFWYPVDWFTRVAEDGPLPVTLQTHTELVDAATAALGAPLAAVPHSAIMNAYPAAPIFEGAEWDADGDSVNDMAIHFYHPLGLTHEWPNQITAGGLTWRANDVMLDFFSRFGGLK